ncbi:MAG: tRNA epoxyqueuosine(34) reductase QueG [Pontibacterium sp.]
MPNPTPSSLNSAAALADFATQIKAWARELGFQDCGITLPELAKEAPYLEQWLEAGYHGEMDYLANHKDKRTNPALLHPNTQRVICVRMDYMPPNAQKKQTLVNRSKAYIARYTLGRDYHKVMRKRLTQLGKKIEAELGARSYRGFVDSAPILERPLAREAGLGWIGKHGLLLNKEAGSWFLLGELLIDLPLPVDAPETENHCGSCTACMDVCPTQAFTKPGVLDARRCISYLTIELKGSIPEEFRAAIGNRVFGCDDCQIICPWNRFSQITQEADFYPRHQLDSSDLATLFLWDEQTFLSHTEGSAIRRTGYEGWLRNLAIGLGNSEGGETVEQALRTRLTYPSELVQEHVHWALAQLNRNQNEAEKQQTSHPIVTHPRFHKAAD